jgi:hypothetical protein
MSLFKNLFESVRVTSSLNTDLIAKIRRVKMEREGYNTSSINWEHYAKVLEAKKEKILASS